LTLQNRLRSNSKINSDKYCSEASQFFDIFGYVRDEAKLDERLKLDMEGVCKTAISQEMDTLILGASGCGAFKHDPNKEAKLWKEVLDQYSLYFKMVIFSILPDAKRQDNVKAFQKYFGPSTQL
jgi:uncharacterized protein (TIGR02452 family)